MSHDYIAFRNLSTKFQTHFFLENSAFFSKFRSQNFNKECAQNAGNRISEALDFKIFRGRIPPDPPTYATFGSYASVSPHAGSAPDVDHILDLQQSLPNLIVDWVLGPPCF